MSFLGPAEWHGGKYLVSPAVLDEFLQPYYYTFVQAKRRLHIAQCYQGQPYKFFQELDFPWELDINLVLSLIPQVVQIVTEEAAAHYGFEQQQLQPILSMRTPYKVHEKHYSEVQLEGGVWMRQPLSYAALQRCSILLDAMEARVFEQSQDFLEAVYQAADSREQLLSAKRIIRSCNKQLQQQVALWREMQEQQQELAQEQEQLLVQQQQLLHALQEEDERQQQAALAAAQQLAQELQEAEQQAAAAAAEAAARQAAEAAEAARQQQQRKQEALAKLQAAQQQQQQQQPGAAGQPLLRKPGLVRPGVVPQQPPQPPPPPPPQQPQQQQQQQQQHPAVGAPP
ncbi:hypothetical protein OEZ85_006756 [Tetradesmus obliquus]|uniref:Uncharacterized protein n=1 Tax=Tetradesmus obliquus TaxID=3088 RepID=A0ABY8TVK5_TETOB|nr:hypothetical protein OEZ85_006756 [Tetradesmus obliquus]